MQIITLLLMIYLTRPTKTVATYLKTKVTGFYSINGHGVLEFQKNLAGEL